LARSITHREQFVEAIASGDAERAAAIMHAHLAGGDRPSTPPVRQPFPADPGVQPGSTLRRIVQRAMHEKCRSAAERRFGCRIDERQRLVCIYFVDSSIVSTSTGAPLIENLNFEVFGSL
jgi:hypothetical protein